MARLYYDMGTKRLWIITAEILVKPRVTEVLKSYEWGVLGIEAARPFDDSRSYDPDLLHIVDKARTNPNACIIGTVFSYKPD